MFTQEDKQKWLDIYQKTPGKYTRTGLKKVFISDYNILMIEQNPDKPSKWASMKREGKKVVQTYMINPSETDQHIPIGVFVDGKFNEYQK